MANLPAVVKACSRDGCERQARSRGMCHSHYTLWLRTYTGTRTTRTSTNEAINEHAPGSIYQLVQRTKISYATVARILQRMHAAGEVHICDWIPPVGGQGSRWVAVFDVGSKRDKPTPSDEEKRVFRNTTNRAKHRAKMVRHDSGNLAAPFAQLFAIAKFRRPSQHQQG